MSKECVALVLDVGRDMDPWMDQARKIIKSLVQSKLTYGGSHEMTLITMGGETDNPCNDQYGGFDHLALVAPVKKPTLMLLKTIDALYPDGEGESMVSEALILAMEVIQSRVKSYKFSRTVYIVTTGSYIGAIAEAFVRAKDENVNINIVIAGPPGYTPTNVLDGMEGAELGHIMSLEDAVARYCSLSSRQVKTSAKFKGTLEITPALQIPIMAYSKTLAMNIPNLKKASRPAVEALKSGSKGKHVYNSAKVKAIKAYYNKLDVDGDGEEIDEADLIISYRYGKSQIPFSSIDEESLRLKTTACCQVIGFLPRTSIPRHHLMGTVDSLAPLYDEEAGLTALASFIYALHELDFVGIVRYVKKNDNEPWLTVVVPYVTDSETCLNLCRIPCDDDIRDFPFATYMNRAEFQPSDSQKSTMTEFVNSMDLMTAGTDNDGNPVEALNLSNTYNPGLQRFYNTVQTKALNPNAVHGDFDPRIDASLNPQRELFHRSPESLVRLAEAFPLHIVDKRKTGSGPKRHWRDAMEAEELFNGVGGASKHFKVNELANVDDGMMSIDSVLNRNLSSVGLVDPVTDFSGLLSKAGSDETLLSQAFNQMWKRVAEFAKSSSNGNQFLKATDCLLCLHEHSKALSRFSEYNSSLTGLKSISEYWKFLSLFSERSKIAPFGTDVFPASALSPREADNFFNLAEALKSRSEDEEDLFDDMD